MFRARVLILLVLPILACLCLDTQANDRSRIRSLTELHQLAKIEKDPAHRLTEARGAYLNRRALIRDFPELSTLTNNEIWSLLLPQAALLSKRQLLLSGIRNSSPKVDLSETLFLYRPPHFNRSAMTPLTFGGKTLGLIDVKGSGHGDDSEVAEQVEEFSRNPGNFGLRDKGHSDGLVAGGEGAAEASRQQNLQRLFEVYNYLHGSDYQTLETYAIIDTGFDVLRSKGSLPAVLYLRQADLGRNQGLFLPADFEAFERGAFQFTRGLARVDFGATLLKPLFLHSHFGPLDLKAELKGADPQMMRPWAWGSGTADAFRNGDLDAYRRHIEDEMTEIPWASAEAKAAGYGTEIYEIATAYEAKKQSSTSKDFAESFEALFKMEQPTQEKLEEVRRLLNQVPAFLEVNLSIFELPDFKLDRKSPEAIRKSHDQYLALQLFQAGATSESIARKIQFTELAFHLSEAGAVQIMKSMTDLGEIARTVRSKADFDANEGLWAERALEIFWEALGSKDAVVTRTFLKFLDAFKTSDRFDIFSLSDRLKRDGGETEVVNLLSVALDKKELASVRDVAKTLMRGLMFARDLKPMKLPYRIKELLGKAKDFDGSLSRDEDSDLFIFATNIEGWIERRGIQFWPSESCAAGLLKVAAAAN